MNRACRVIAETYGDYLKTIYYKARVMPLLMGI